MSNLFSMIKENALKFILLTCNQATIMKRIDFMKESQYNKPNSLNGKPIVLKNLKKNFISGDEIIHAVDDIDLEISQGEFVIIMGPSGSGKSTLLSLISGLTSLTEGRILINGEDMKNFTENQKALLRRREIGIVFQF